MNTEIEKRRYPKAPLSLPVIVMTSIGPMKGRTANLSVDGSFLVLLSSKPLSDDEFQMTLRISENQEIIASCEKVWEGEFVVGGATLHGLGVKFNRISPSDREIIAAKVEEYCLG